MTTVDDEDLGRLRTVFGRMSRVLSREVETGGLTRTQTSVLASVVRQGPIGVGELAEIEGINPTMLSRMVGKLDEAGLIRRVADQQDRRVTRLEATEHGRAVHESMRSDRSRLLAAALDGLDPADRNQVVDCLGALEALVAQAHSLRRRAPGRFDQQGPGSIDQDGPGSIDQQAPGSIDQAGPGSIDQQVPGLLAATSGVSL